MGINFLEYIVILVLILLNAFFAASEIAIVTVRKTRIKQLAEAGSGAARSVLRLNENTARFLSTIQVGITLAGFFASAFGAVSLVKIFEGWFISIPVDFIRDASYTLAFVLVTILLAFISIVFGELIPKTLAIESAERISLLVARPIELLSKIATPFVWTLSTVSNFFVRILGGKRKANLPSVSQEEIASMVETGTEEGVLEKHEGEIINRLFEFTDREVADIMVPRPDVTMVSEASTVGEVAKEIVAHGYSRYPIFAAENRERILGVIYAKDIINQLSEGKAAAPVMELLRPPYFVPESKKIGTLLSELQKSRTHLAIVIDEYGGMAGLVTLEDILEEIVGEIQDEYDAEESRIKKQPDGTFLVYGGTSLDELNSTLGLDLKEEKVDTVGGLLFKQLGRIGRVGDTITLNTAYPSERSDGPNPDEAPSRIILKVAEMDRLRISQVKLIFEPREVQALDETKITNSV